MPANGRRDLIRRLKVNVVDIIFHWWLILPDDDALMSRNKLQ
jgi:hypothetical protein